MSCIHSWESATNFKANSIQNVKIAWLRAIDPKSGKVHFCCYNFHFTSCNPVACNAPMRVKYLQHFEALCAYLVHDFWYFRVHFSIGDLLNCRARNGATLGTICIIFLEIPAALCCRYNKTGQFFWVDFVDCRPDGPVIELSTIRHKCHNPSKYPQIYRLPLFYEFRTYRYHGALYVHIRKIYHAA